MVSRDTTFRASGRSGFTFEYPWFNEEQRATSDQYAISLRGEKHNKLGVGYVEGCSEKWMLDNLVGLFESRKTVFHTFQGRMEPQSGATYDQSSIEKRFWSNVSEVHVVKATSEDALLDWAMTVLAHTLTRCTSR